jgi:hypothetical protein
MLDLPNKFARPQGALRVHRELCASTGSFARPWGALSPQVQLCYRGSTISREHSIAKAPYRESTVSRERSFPARTPARPLSTAAISAVGSVHDRQCPRQAVFTTLRRQVRQLQGPDNCKGPATARTRQLQGSGSCKGPATAAGMLASTGRARRDSRRGRRDRFSVGGPRLSPPSSLLLASACSNRRAWG